ncbi:TlpA family protein disulfide reductase [Verrucomicrobiaceae bacterium 5K15]|uniref:TlpA family protein disulfide reductase n=1 Tax=Oceaniferula flava TaxID=2800421 RepID=A0AAE2SBW6_9BACT|nr:TlpA disulfide reductase family protein [Oceaniferula flavus]MBK1855335.1 TlpA family protein disulfide reductase [Oceaniferula flavus]MBM1136641.1 TlpA family protein disulfide reductase [Oceaniferula flavus]
MTTIHAASRSIFSASLTPFFRLSLLLASTVMAAAPVGAQQAATKASVVAGSEVSLSAITQATWVQGEGPKAFEPGKVYIFECWATWCGPCIMMIPHVNELHKKYYDKGLRVYGMSVWEDDQAKVEKFVKFKGAKMSYPVAFTGKGSAFESEWLKAAGVKSIPHAFIVRNGKLLASTQASRLTDQLIETLLAGDEGAQQGANTLLSAQNQQGKTKQLVQAIYNARNKQDAAKMSTLLKQLKGIDSAHPEIPILELWVLIVCKDWPAAVTELKEMPVSETKNSFISMTGMRLARSEQHGYPEDFMKAFVPLYADYVLRNESPIGPNHFVSLSIHQWRLGNKEDAAMTAKQGVAAAKAFAVGRALPIQPYGRFAKSVHEGSLPTLKDLSKWQREAREQAAPKK